MKISKETFESISGTMWIIVFLLLMVAWLVPQLLYLPLILLLALIAIPVYKFIAKGEDIEVSDILPESVAVILLIIALAVPDALLLLAGVALGEVLRVVGVLTDEGLEL